MKTLSGDNKASLNALAAIILVILLAVGSATVGALIKQSNDNPSEDGATFENPGIGTTADYMVENYVYQDDVPVLYETDEYHIEVLSENSDTYWSLENNQFNLSSGMTMKETILKGNAFSYSGELTATEKIKTCDGKVTVDIYTNENFEYVVGQDDSGQCNNALYRMIYFGENKVTVYTLVSYDLRAHEEYVPSGLVGLSLGTFSNGEDSIEIEVLGEHDGTLLIGTSDDAYSVFYFFIESGAIIDMEDTGTKEITYKEETVTVTMMERFGMGLYYGEISLIMNAAAMFHDKVLIGFCYAEYLDGEYSDMGVIFLLDE